MSRFHVISKLIQPSSVRFGIHFIEKFVFLLSSIYIAILIQFLLLDSHTALNRDSIPNVWIRRNVAYFVLINIILMGICLRVSETHLETQLRLPLHCRSIRVFYLILTFVSMNIRRESQKTQCFTSWIFAQLLGVSIALVVITHRSN